MININPKNNTKSGSTLLELLFYIAFFTVLSLILINSMIIMARSLKETSIQAELTQSGDIMERISREIRGASDINSINTNDLNLKTTDGRNPEIKLSGTNVQIWENSTLTGNLNTSNIIITAMTFTQITTLQGKAINVSLTLKASDDTYGRLVNFHDTVVLRGIY
jgi:Tfp pilus assembly protein PilE